MRTMSDAITRLVRIHGRVQGVFFRKWTTEKALGLGLDGWVRNRGDGTVEALFHGPEPAVEEMLVLCREGPHFADVSHMDVTESVPPSMDGFETRPTV